MVEIQSKEVIDKVSQELKIQPSVQIPTIIDNKISLVYNVNLREKGIHSHASRSVTGAGGIFTIPDDKRDYYLVSLTMSLTFNGTCDSVKTFIRGDPADAGTINVELLTLVYNPGTVAADHLSITKIFPVPIRLAAGSTIDQVNAFTAGGQTTVSSAVLFSIDRQ